MTPFSKPCGPAHAGNAARAASPLSATALRPRRHGLTITEVVAGLVLMTTVLSAVFIARGRFLQQWADADRQLQATHAVDTLIGQWLAGPPDRIPMNGEGVLGGVESCRWTTRRIIDPAAQGLGVKTVRLEVHRTADNVTARADRFVLAVEFVLPDEYGSAAARREAD
ncbi:hypothetical protein [Humisphaera borealis]|uniref:Type II secretion system protein n=1 Tax=Humisphaera borealis TaxID=2807512 RepID=A0A7M2X4J1_9BACT|nr:hypothetical protein [Humisphaera borealis]QOV92575.1 hypothetical protein IPV69_06345 [Humisphaera borealis]